MSAFAPRLERAAAAALALVGALAFASQGHAKTVGSDLDALDPTTTITCPSGDACILAQALGGNGTPFSPPSGIVTRWSVKLGSRAPEGIRLVVQDAGGSAGAGKGRRTIDVGSLRRELIADGTATFSERLPIHGDETFGVRLEAASRAGTRATIAAPFADEYRTLLLWDPPPPFGGPSPLPTQVLQDTRIAISIEVFDPSPDRCDPFNLYTGSGRGDDYGGFPDGGDVIRGLGGDDLLRGLRLEDCVYGGRGNDRIAGMDGDDALTGGPGRDDVGAGEGDDWILVRDGERDTVRCGGGWDFVKADRADSLRDCERVRRG